MTDHLIRKRPQLIDPAGEPIKASVWKDLTFRKNGHTHRGLNILPIQEAAADAMAAGERLFFGHLQNEVDCNVESLDGAFRASVYSHTIQVPVKP